MKTKKNNGIKKPFHSNKNAIEIKPNEMMYPVEPIYINFFLPYLSIRDIPTNVNIKLMSPIPILLKNDADFSNPANSKILGA
jgi:hypothetical protein